MKNIFLWFFFLILTISCERKPSFEEKILVEIKKKLDETNIMALDSLILFDGFDISGQVAVKTKISKLKYYETLIDSLFINDTSSVFEINEGMKKIDSAFCEDKKVYFNDREKDITTICMSKFYRIENPKLYLGTYLSVFTGDPKTTQGGLFIVNSDSSYYIRLW